MSTQELAERPTQPPSKYERLFQAAYYAMGGFLLITAAGQFLMAAFSQGNRAAWFSAISYGIFVAIVFFAASAKTSKKAQSGQPIGFRERAGALLASFFVTILIGILVVVGIIFALFVACLTVLGSSAF